MSKIVNKDSVNFTLTDDIGLCYFDPSTEKLVEFHEGANIVLAPFEEVVRRFYIVKTNSTVSGKVVNYCKLLAIPATEHLDIRTRLGHERLSYPQDFYDSEVSVGTVAFFSLYPSGIIPIDILFKSNTNKALETSLEISLEVN